MHPSSGQVAMEGDSCSRGCEVESQHGYCVDRFHTYLLNWCLKRLEKMKKRLWKGHFETFNDARPQTRHEVQTLKLCLIVYLPFTA